MPNSYLVEVGDRMFRRNRWHLIEAPYRNDNINNKIKHPILHCDWPETDAVRPEDNVVVLLEVLQPQVRDNDGERNVIINQRPVRQKRVPFWMRDYV